MTLTIYHFVKAWLHYDPGYQKEFICDSLLVLAEIYAIKLFYRNESILESTKVFNFADSRSIICLVLVMIPLLLLLGRKLMRIRSNAKILGDSHQEN